MKSYVFVSADLRAPIRMPVVALMNSLAQQGNTVTVITNQKNAYDDYRYDYRIVRRSMAEPFKGLNTRAEILTHIASQMPSSVFVLTNIRTIVPDARAIREASADCEHKIVVWELLPLYSLLLKTNYAEYSSVLACADLFDAFVTNYSQGDTLQRYFNQPGLRYIPFFFPFQSAEYSVIEGTGKQILFVQNGAQNYLFDRVLEALAIVRETDPEVTLKFVNGINTSEFGEDAQALAHGLAEQFGVADAISFAQPGCSLKALMRESLFAVSASGTVSHSSATMLMHACRFPYIFACGWAAVDNFACIDAVDVSQPETLADEMLRCLQPEVREQKQHKMTKALDAGVDLFALRSWATLLSCLDEGKTIPDFCDPAGISLQAEDLLAQATMYHIQRTAQTALVPAQDVPRKRFARLRKTLRYWELRRTQKYTYTQMSPEDVRRSQLLALMLLREFERICIRHDLVYYVAAGSLLGAVRHHGPIPWDDDVDVTMPRKDYNRFIEIAQQELPDTMILPKNNYPYAFHRMQMKGTNIERMLRQRGVHGIFLDILPLDGAAPTEALKKRHEWISSRLMYYMFESARPIQPLNQIRGNGKLYLKRMILKVFAPRHLLHFLWRRNAEKYDVDTAEEWVCLPGSYGYEKECFPKSYWGEPAWLEYEHKMCPVMRHWEDYLQMHYGDYMQCPSELEKRTHLLFSIDFGRYADIPISDLEQSVLQTSERLQQAASE